MRLWTIHPTYLDTKGLLAVMRHQNASKYQEVESVEEPELHPLFYVIEGDIEDWVEGFVMTHLTPVQTNTLHTLRIRGSS